MSVLAFYVPIEFIVYVETFLFPRKATKAKTKFNSKNRAHHFEISDASMTEFMIFGGRKPICLDNLYHIRLVYLKVTSLIKHTYFPDDKICLRLHS